MQCGLRPTPGYVADIGLGNDTPGQFTWAELASQLKGMGLRREDGPELDDAGMAQVLRDITDGKYVQGNPTRLPATLPLAQAILRWRRGEAWGMLNLQDGITTMARSTLVLIGRAGRHTGLHLDRAEAVNVAFGVLLPTRRRTLRRVLARWTLFSPKIVHILAAHARKKAPDMARWHDVFVDDATIRDIKVEAASVPCEDGSAHVVEVDQCAGMRVWVPPGYVHQVVNHEDCVKVAWDFVEAKHMHLCVQHSVDVGSGAIGASGNDYVALPSVLEAGLKHWATLR